MGIGRMFLFCSGRRVGGFVDVGVEVWKGGNLWGF